MVITVRQVPYMLYTWQGKQQKCIAWACLMHKTMQKSLVDVVSKFQKLSAAQNASIRKRSNTDFQLLLRQGTRYALPGETE